MYPSKTIQSPFLLAAPFPASVGVGISAESHLDGCALVHVHAQVGDDVVLRSFGVVAQQLTPHHLGTELGGLDVKR